MLRNDKDEVKIGLNFNPSDCGQKWSSQLTNVNNKNSFSKKVYTPSEFKKDGLRVKFKGRIRYDLASFHMWGYIIEIIEIKKL
ncbi:MAG: hypothetical protein ACE5WD_09020 [Candidatus Aminicenantia bacterium]